MRKAFIILTGILFTLLCATCKQFTADIDGYLSYWSSEAFIRSSAINTKTYNDGSGIVSVASANDVTVTLKVQNPKSFKFVMPSASETRNIVGFAHLGGTKPAVSADYELKQLTADTLQLVYKTSFLKNAEWGEKDVSSTITLYANDGREFKQTFTVPLKVNTPPPNPGFAVIKTKGSPAYYVLCFTIPDMDKTVPGGLLHKDLARIEVNGTPYTFSVNEAQTAFTKPEAPVFITHSDVEKLTEPEADDVPADSSWVLYYKTDVEVKDGAAKKDYTIKLIDKKGLTSGIVNANTKPNKAETEIVRITKGTEISGSGNESDPTIIGTDSSGAEIRVSSGTANTMVHCTLTDGSTPVKYDGNPVTVPLPLNGAGEKQYKLEYYTDGEGFAATPVKTVYYKVVKGHTVTFNANGGTYPGGATVVSKAALYGTTISQPDPLPKKQGYGLTGWYNNPGTTGPAWNFDTDIVTGDMPLYAKWTAGADTPYNVEHYQQKLDGSYPEMPTETEGKTGTTDASISYSDIKKTYEGFNYDHITPTAPTIEANGSTVVKVYYKRKTYTVTYSVDGSGSSGSISVTDVTGGSVGGSPVTVKHGGSVRFTATPNTSNGYEMDSWSNNVGNISSDKTQATLSNVTSATTVKVKFKLKKYTVTFKVDGGEGKLNGVYGSQNNTAENGHGEMTLTNVPHGTQVPFTATPKYGWEVEGWTASAGTLSGGGTGTTATLTVTDNATVKVKFKKITTVNGGDGAWKLLKKVVEIADDNVIITINGTIQATNGADNSGEITFGTLANELTIQSGSPAGVLDANGKSRIFKVEGGKTLTLKNLTLQNGAVPNPPYGSSDGGGGILVDGGTVRMTNCTIKDCKAGVQKTSGGAIRIEGTGAKVYIAGGEISGNRANRGGGISISGGKLYINTDDSGNPNDSSTQTNITNNLVADNGFGYRGDGGAIYSDSNSELKLHNTKISQCGSKTSRNPSTTQGGGLYIDRGTAVLTSVEISQGIFETTGGGGYNSVQGGAIYSENADVTLGKSGTPAYSCYIHHNTIRGNDSSGAFEGGGIYSYRGTLKIYGGKIEFNKVEGHLAKGGGIGQNETHLLLDGTVITDNTASYRGGGVDGLNNTSFTMKGSATVTPKADTSGKHENDVYLPVNAKIIIEGELTPVGGTAARITPEDYGTTKPVLAGDITTGTPENYKKFTVTPNGSELWGIDNNGKLKRAN